VKYVPQEMKIRIKAEADGLPHLNCRAQASAAENFCTHVIAEADKQAAEIAEPVFMSEKTG
jgi:hypothetical protein